MNPSGPGASLPVDEQDWHWNGWKLAAFLAGASIWLGIGRLIWELTRR